MTNSLNNLLNLPNDSRLWVFQSDRKLADNDIHSINTTLDQFMGEWNAHGSELKGCFAIIDKLFVVIAVNEANQAASGCSIDSMTNSIKKIGSKLAINFLDRSKVGVEFKEGVELVSVVDVNEFAKMKRLERIVVRNTAINSVEQFKTKWSIEWQESGLQHITEEVASFKFKL